MGETIYVNRMYQIETHENPDRITKHIYVGDTRMASKLSHSDVPTSGYEQENTYHYHGDHLGSSNIVTDYEGRVFEHLEYTPWGEAWVEDGSDALSKVDWLFSAKERDPKTGLYSFPARYYNPENSRWLSTDPAFGEYLPERPVDKQARKRNRNLPGEGGVSNPVNLNVYHYALNNPLEYTDPTGLSGVAEQSKEPWQIAYDQYKESVMEQIQGPSLAEQKDFSNNVDRAVTGMSDREFSELNLEWAGAKDDIADKRGEIMSDLSSLYHALNGIEGLKDEATILLTIGAASGVAEYYSTGSAQGIAETLYQAGEYVSNQDSSGRLTNRLMTDITRGVSELSPLRQSANTIGRRFIAERKRRDYWGIGQ